MRELDWSGHDLTLDDLNGFCAGIEASLFRIKRLKLSGGEPTLHPQLYEIIARLDQWKKAKELLDSIWVQTNSTRPTQPLPPGWKWKRGDTTGKFHEPWLLSPYDMGVRGIWSRKGCSIARICGRSYEHGGWAMCGLANTLGRLLKINVFTEKPSLDYVLPVCQHCIWSIPSPARDGLHWAVYAAITPYPSATFAKALGVEPQYMPDRMFRQIHYLRRHVPRGRRPKNGDSN